MKILYAAGNRAGSFFQLKRFIDSVRNKKIELKVSAYKKSIGNLDVDYTLDCLLNFTNPNEKFSFNGNYNYYYNEIKRFSPDLIISDLDIHTSIIALELGIKLWQASPLLLYSALPRDIKYNIKLYKNYSHVFNANFRKKEFINYIINNSDKKFVISHLCDSDRLIPLATGFEWARPEFILADKLSEETEFLLMRGSRDKNIINSLRNTNSVMFTEFYHEEYERLAVKNIYDEKEYIKQIARCKIFITDGCAITTADAFYNQKPLLFDLQYSDVESLIVSFANEYFKIGKIISDNIDADNLSPAKIIVNDKVKFLHEELKTI